MYNKDKEENIMNKIEDLENIRQDRAWIEINLDNLEYNINQIMKIINNKTKIMAVVKANSYGLGMIEISKKLNEIGIEDFAVATLSEGITLRKNNIKGNLRKAIIQNMKNMFV